MCTFFGSPCCKKRRQCCVQHYTTHSKKSDKHVFTDTEADTEYYEDFEEYSEYDIPKIDTNQKTCDNYFYNEIP